MRYLCPLLLLAVPTGWLYNLWAGKGMPVFSQRRSADPTAEECTTFLFDQTPATVTGGKLTACPLARLRDVTQTEMHYQHNGGIKRSVYISEYIAADYLLSPWKNILQPNFEGELLPLTFLGGHVIILLTLQLHKR